VTDIDDEHRRILTDFGVYQMKLNPAGIGNECTHWIYAALFEARALDHDRALHIAQTAPHYTWGRDVLPRDVQRGDIAQFHGFQNRFFIYQNSAGGSKWLESTQIRGPNHTGMVFTTPKNGAYYQLESHLHQQGTPRMKVRGNTIYYEQFAIVLSAADLQQIQGTSAWPADVDTDDITDMLERIDWVGLRANHTMNLVAADALVPRIKRGVAPVQANGISIGCLCVIHAQGYLRFSCPQQSRSRLGMDDTQLAGEKADLIHSMIRGGRRGGATIKLNVCTTSVLIGHTLVTVRRPLLSHSAGVERRPGAGRT
jgi:hypothetical protein